MAGSPLLPNSKHKGGPISRVLCEKWGWWLPSHFLAIFEYFRNRNIRVSTNQHNFLFEKFCSANNAAWKY
jgi:hypothetical protein